MVIPWWAWVLAAVLMALAILALLGVRFDLTVR